MRKKRIDKILCTILAMILGLSVSVFASDDELVISASDVSGNPGGSITVNVVLSSNGSQIFDIANASFSLVLPKNIVQVNEVKCDPDGVFDSINNLLEYGVLDLSNGIVTVVGSGQMTKSEVEALGIRYPVKIATISLSIKDSAPYGKYDLRFTASSVARTDKPNGGPKVHEPVAHQTQDGSITVSEKKTIGVVDTGGGKKYYEGEQQPGGEQPGGEQPGGEQPKGAEKFKDLAGFEWAYESIDELVKAGIISGTSETTYEPQRNITRAEFCKLIAMAFGFEASDASISFSDVNSDAWYYQVVTSAAKNGIVTGYEDGSFRPEAFITREEMAAMLVRAFKAAGVEVPEGEMTFADADEMGDWSVDLIASLAKMGIVSGRGDNRFVPRDNLTRAEAAKVIYSAYKIMQEKESE